METPRFVHLHLHTDYSLLDGACDLEEVVDEAARRKMPAVAVTDHGNLFAAESFYHDRENPRRKAHHRLRSLRRQGQPPRSRRKLHARRRQRPFAGRTRPARQQSPRPALRKRRRLPQSRQAGLRRLSRRFLLQAANRLRPARKTQRRADRSLRLPARRRHRKSGRGAPRPRPAKPPTACAIFSAKEISSSKFRIRAWTSTSASIRRSSRSRKETGIPLVATNDCHYLKHSDAHAQEVLLCIQTGKTMSDTHRMKFATDQFFFKTAEEMAQVFGELPDALERTVCHRRPLQRKNRSGEKFLPGFSGSRRPHGRHLFRRRRSRRVSPRACPILEARAKAGLLRKTLRRIRNAPRRMKSA